MIKSLISNAEDSSQAQFTRNYDVVEIRRSHREQTFRKKRVFHLHSQNICTTYLQPTIIDERFRENLQQIYSQQFQEEQLPELFHNTYHNDVLAVLRSAVGLRKIINREHNIGDIMAGEGRAQAIARLLKMNEYPQIVLEATWCVANIASVQSVNVLLLKDSGIVDAIIELMGQKECPMTIFQHASIAISNIAIENPQLRDEIIKGGCIESIIETLMQKGDLKADTIQNLIWTLTNLCRGDPKPAYQTIAMGVKYIAFLISGSRDAITDPDILSDCIFTLVHTIEFQNENLEQFVHIGAVKQVIGLCTNNPHTRQIIGCLRILGNLAAGSDWVVSQLYANNIIDTLAKTITHSRALVRRQTCWILSNIAATKYEYAVNIVFYPNLFDCLYACAQDPDDNIRKQVCYVFSNIVLRLRPEESLHLLIEGRVMEIICAMLDCQSSNTLKGVLQCISTIFKHFLGNENEYYDIISEHFKIKKGSQKLQRLTYHNNAYIRKQVNHIINAYIEVREDNTFQGQKYKKQTSEQESEEDSILLQQFRLELFGKTDKADCSDQ